MAAAGTGTLSSSIDIPGEPSKTSTSLLETGTGLIQGFTPINKIHQHLCAFHFYAYDLTRQVEAHHYCTHYNEDLRQCLIYDTPEKDARLIGIEYIVSEKLFMQLPDEEKQLWHSHEYEVKSGVLFLPGIPATVQHQDLAKVCKTYGKTFHFWQFDKGDRLPLGAPQLMMALTSDGQLDEELAANVQARFNYSYEEEKESRKSMTGPDNGIHPLANSWIRGKGLKTELRETDCFPKSF